MTDLKPCPFCGGKAEFRKVKGAPYFPCIFVICPKCLTTSDNYSNNEDAAANWNRRIQDAGN